MVRPVPTDDAPGSRPAAVRPAATVMLVRDGAAGLEVFVLRRVPQMEFAPRMTVFPGGAVDPADHHPAIGWEGPDPSWWATHLGAGEAAARALVVAAVRELFEETGVLLAGPAGAAAEGPVGRLDDGPAAGLDNAVRLAILGRSVTLHAALAAAGLRLRADLLRPWANWVTPPGPSRRYDTFFFTAALPTGQRAEMLTTEADLGQWRLPQALLAERDAGATALMPPTTAMLTDLAGFTSVAAVLAAQRVVTAVRPRPSDFPGFGIPADGGRR